MKVECIELLDVHGNAIEDHPSLTVGKEYDVLGIDCSSSRQAELRILSDDDRLPILVKSHQFRLIEPSLPGCWTLNLEPQGYLSIYPEQWHRSGFWEEFFDGEPNAKREYEVELEKILGEGVNPEIRQEN